MQRELFVLARPLLPQGEGRVIPAHNLHLTLVFLGQIDEQRRHCLELRAERIARAGFDLTFDHCGHWPRPQVVWLGTTVLPASLVGLVSDLKAAAGHCGLETERRAYAPHLTIARKVRRRCEGRAISPWRWRVGSFALVESLSEPGGVRYVPLRFWPLPAGED